MAKKIVFINQATGYLTIDIINAFAAHYDDVSLIAGSIRVQDIPLHNKVQWSKIALYDRGSPARKLISWIKGTIQIFMLLLTRYRDYEVFYITIPPFAYLLSVLLPNRFAVLVFDVYPDVLKIYNVNAASPVYRLWAWLNRKVLKKSHRVFTISAGLAQLLSVYVPREKISVIPLWTGLTKVKPVAKDRNHWLKNLNLEKKFIVQYSGNIGYTHNVEVLVEVAKVMADVEDIHFLIIGRGERVEHIQALINRYQLENCTLLPFQPDSELMYSLAAADLGVVILDEKTAHVSLPSKIFNLQAVGVPIICISALDSELNEHLRTYGNGRCFLQSDVSSIVEFICRMKNEPAELQELARNSRNAAQLFTMQNAEDYYRDYIS